MRLSTDASKCMPAILKANQGKVSVRQQRVDWNYTAQLIAILYALCRDHQCGDSDSQCQTLQMFARQINFAACAL